MSMIWCRLDDHLASVSRPMMELAGPFPPLHEARENVSSGSGRTVWSNSWLMRPSASARE
jgi:hypothetical protein